MECDFCCDCIYYTWRYFNSRTHVECDIYQVLSADVGNKFQLTHSRGVRPEAEERNTIGTHFNSRTHVECDGIGNFLIQLFVDFNSRTHVECDNIYDSK